MVKSPFLWPQLGLLCSFRRQMICRWVIIPKQKAIPLVVCPMSISWDITVLLVLHRTRRFSEPTFRPSGAPNHWKNTVFRDFPTFSRICIFFLLTLSLLLFSLLIFLFSLPLPCSAFHLSILSEVWLLNFLRSVYHVYILHAAYTRSHAYLHAGSTPAAQELLGYRWILLRIGYYCDLLRLSDHTGQVGFQASAKAYMPS